MKHLQFSAQGITFPRRGGEGEYDLKKATKMMALKRWKTAEQPLA